MLMNEFFKVQGEATAETDSAITVLVDTVMPSVLFKTNYEKAFIRDEANSVMNNSINICVTQNMLKVLLECNHNKIIPIIENIAGFIAVYISKSGKEFYTSYASAPADTQEVLKRLVVELSNGIESTPRIKKQHVVNVK